MCQRFKLIICALCTVFATFHANAAKIEKVKGKQVLISLDGEPAQIGDFYFIVTPQGKKTGILKITQVKGNKAMAVLGKGKAQPGLALEYRPPKAGPGTQTAGGGGSAPKQASSSKKSSDSKMDEQRAYWGVMAGMGMNNMSVDLKNAAGATRATEKLSGNAFSFKGLFDYNVFDRVWFRGTFGLEGFNVSGNNNCGPGPATFTQTCDAKINYLTADFWGRYAFSHGKIRPWVGAGVSLWFPASVSATALDENSITSTTVLSPGIGVDWFVTPRIYIPLQIEYGLLPESEEVSANLIAVRLGVGFAF